MKTRSALAIVTCLAVFGLLSSSALGGISIPLPPSVNLGGRTNPMRPPHGTPAPISLTLDGTISNTEAPEERPPALKSLLLKFDRNGAIFTKGLATCRWDPQVAEFSIVRICRDALVGHGEVEFQITPPESPTFRTESPMLIFNGPPMDGRPVLIYYVYAHVPAPTTLLASVVIEEAHGKFGTQTTIPVPKIVNGNGSLTGFRAEIGKTWLYRGRRVNLLSAQCPRGRLAAHAEFEFVDGDLGQAEVGEHCAAGR